MNCPACNTPNPGDAKFCINCGMRLKASPPSPSRDQSFPAYTVTTAKLAAHKVSTKLHVWHALNPIVATVITSFVVGFIIAGATWGILGLIIDMPVGNTPPGGSIGFGFSTGMNYTRKFGYGLLGAVSGLLGWVLFLLLTSWLF